MKPELPYSLQMLKEACKKYKYDFKIVDRVGNNLAEISNSKKSFYSSNQRPGTFPLNFSFSSGITKDKTWTTKILKEKGFRTIKGEHFFLNDKHIDYRKNGREICDALNYAQDKYPVFVKPNDSSSGLLAEIIHKEGELLKHLSKIEKISEIGIIQEVKNLDEYRIFAVDGRVQFMYQRKSACLRGDGKKRVDELLVELNQKITKKKNKILETDIFFRGVLSKNGFNLESILPKNRKINISSKANLSAGGEIKNYKKVVPTQINKWVSGLMKVFSLKVCGIDIFVDGDSDFPDNFIVIEVNPNPGLSGIYREGYKDDTMEIWRIVLEKYFKN
ncbi:MAG: hypothetical protein PF572_05885 [Patescibacteria group bacterium]|jgi:D-alanine-D-alanine ligase-like ATP-grasp enzyme|nr:hypothetical protein [Patescibacteria group bacterium]